MISVVADETAEVAHKTLDLILIETGPDHASDDPKHGLVTASFSWIEAGKGGQTGDVGAMLDQCVRFDVSDVEDR